MAMGAAATAGSALAAVNAVFLAGLVVIWGQNYRQFRSTMVLGLVAFSAVLLVENLVALYFFYVSMNSLYSSDPSVGTVVLLMRALQFVAISFLTYVTTR